MSVQRSCSHLECFNQNTPEAVSYKDSNWLSKSLFKHGDEGNVNIGKY